MFLMFISSHEAFSKAILNYPKLNTEDNGGRLGLALESGYKFNGMLVFKVTDIDLGSNLFGILKAGVFIYRINNYYFTDSQDYKSIVVPSFPGTTFTIYFIDTYNNDALMEVTVKTKSEGEMKVARQIVVDSQKKYEAPGFCEEHPVVCGLGLLAGAAIVGSVLSGHGSNSKSGNSNDTNTNDNSYLEREIQDSYQNKKDNSSSSSEPRTYGLYGNCPQPGAGYGC